MKRPVNLGEALASFDAVYRHEGEIPDHVDSTTGHEL
jgi:hypothetical protein